LAGYKRSLVYAYIKGKRNKGDWQHTGLFRMWFLLLRPFLMWFLRAFESSGLSSSKLHSSSDETDMTAPQLSNSPQYYNRS
jgi:hypothetical protein